MPYEIRIFCATGRLGAREILDRVLGRAAARGTPLQAGDRESAGDRYASAGIVRAGRERDDAVRLEVFAASQVYTWSTIQDYGADTAVPGLTPDAYALLLPPENVDPGAVKTIWESFSSLWPAVLHDDLFGFDAELSEYEPSPVSVDTELNSLVENARVAVEERLLHGGGAPFTVLLTLDANSGVCTPRYFDSPAPDVAEIVETCRGDREELRGLAVSVVDEGTVETHVEHSRGWAQIVTSPFLVRGQARRRVVWSGSETRPADTLLW